jgi:hypothetical protein
MGALGQELGQTLLSLRSGIRARNPQQIETLCPGSVAQRRLERGGPA